MPSEFFSPLLEIIATILVTNLETLVWFFPSPMLIWVCNHFSAPKYAWLNIGEGKGHIWVRTKVWRVNVRNLENIQDKWLLFPRFLTSIVVSLSKGGSRTPGTLPCLRRWVTSLHLQHDLTEISLVIVPTSSCVVGDAPYFELTACKHGGSLTFIYGLAPQF